MSVSYEIILQRTVIQEATIELTCDSNSLGDAVTQAESEVKDSDWQEVHAYPPAGIKQVERI